MYIKHLEVLTLADFVCCCCGCENDKKLKEDLIKVFQAYLYKKAFQCKTFCVDEELYISHMLRTCNLSYYYFEGFKNYFCYRAFLQFVKIKPVLAVVESKCVKWIFNKEELSNVCGLTIIYFTKDKSKMYICAYGIKKRISKIMLYKVYMNNKIVLSNKCFVTDEGHKENTIKQINTKLDWEQKMSQACNEFFAVKDLMCGI